MELINGFDTVIRHWVFAMRSDWLTAVMLAITSLGNTAQITMIVASIALGLAYFRRYLEAVGFLGVVIGAHVLTEGIKSVVQRARPPLPWLGPAGGFSFPSGHSLVSMALYGFLAYVVMSHVKPSGWRRALMAVLGVMPFLIGISRIYLGVHYPSDVFSGWSLGLIWLGIWISAINLLRSRLEQRRKKGGAGGESVRKH